jgi:acyl-coenzyme A thioesterase PaaI-like protein
MPESWSSRRARWAFNWFPAYRGTGARVEYIAADWLEIRVRLPLSWRTRNYVGTIFGGSLYAALDPMYMVMLMRRLGPAFIVWDKAASIRFLRPGRTTLRATFRLERETVEAIRMEAMRLGKLERDFEVNLVNDAGAIHATCIKTLYVRWREFPGAPAPGNATT